MTHAKPRIAIVGGGIAGTICARMLQLHDIPVTIFEAETGFAIRSQGGSLDIHGDTGQIALEAAGLTEEFERLSNKDASHTRVVDGARGVELYAGIPSGRGWNPEIDRGVLRRMLVDSLLPNTIRWGMKVRAATREQDNRVRLTFADDTTGVFDLVIGADGAWSKVRGLVTRKKPRYTGVSFAETKIENWAETDPVSHSMVEPGSMFAVGPKSVILVHNGRDAWVSAGFWVPKQWHKKIDWPDAAKTKQTIVHHLMAWHPRLRALVENSTIPLMSRPMYVMPVGIRWRRSPGATLIGDAAHLMSLFAGRGANLALLDGMLLGRAIATAGDGWQQAVRAAEVALFRRTWKPALLSAVALHQFFGPDAARRVAYTFTTAQDGVIAKYRRLGNMLNSSLRVRAARLVKPQWHPGAIAAQDIDVSTLRYETHQADLRIEHLQP